MRPYTNQQLRLLQFIKGFREASDGTSPQLDEVAASFDCDQSKIAGRIRTLEKSKSLKWHYDRRTGHHHFTLFTDIPIPRSPEGEPLYFVAVQ